MGSKAISDQIMDCSLPPYGPTAQGAATAMVAMRIRKDIVSGTLPLGGRLKLQEIAARYAAGIMPIRGALRQLEGEGLVEMTPNCGARVRQVNVELIANLFDLRIVIEALLARRAAERIRQEQIEALHSAEILFEESTRRGDQASLLLANRAFHAIVNEAANNPEAMAILARQQDLTTALWSRFGFGHERLPGIIADHHDLIRAVKARDSELAACIATAHATKARNHLLARVSASAQADTARYAVGS